MSDRGVDLCWWSATDLAAALAARAVSPVEVARAHLDRIAAVDPGIGAFVHIDPDRVLAEAGRVAARLVSDGPGGPLDGVPYAVKDLDDVAGSPTSYGVPFLVDNVAGSSSVVAQRLAAAGGVFLGKTNTPELGYRATCRNHAFPPTHNPWRRGMTPGGSSGGSAAAVAAGLTPSPMAPTAPGRSGRPPRSAVSSASSRRSVACPSSSGSTRGSSTTVP